MPRLPSPVRLLLLSSMLLACAAELRAGAGDVYVRGTGEGLAIRVVDADLSNCEVLRPGALRVILVVRHLELTTTSLRDRFELATSVRVLGPEVLGADESRVVVELASSALVAELQEVGAGVVLSLRFPEEAPVAREPEPEPVAEPAEGAERQVTTPWRRSRLSAQRARAEAREGEAGAPDEAEDPADQERLVRAAEDAERRRRREERELRVAQREAEAEGRPAPKLPAVDEGAPGEPGAGTKAPRPEPERRKREPPEPTPATPGEPGARAARAAGRVQPSPATPVPGGMVRVPGGSFLMGSPRGVGLTDEEPQHPVDTDPFWIDAREVTIGEFRRSPIRLPEQPAWNVEDDLPVVNVTWHEAAEYCEWLDKRLPTEAEWEKAARGDDGRTYPWGDGFSVAFVNSGVDGDGFSKTAPVGSFADGGSPSGALDLAGNVWEWTSDWYAPDAHASRPRANPTGPSRGAHKVAKGGSFRGTYSVNVRSAIRQPLAASARRDDVGFRCASAPR